MGPRVQRDRDKLVRYQFYNFLEYKLIKCFILCDSFAMCTLCSSDFSIAYDGISTHVREKHHRYKADACSFR